MTDTYQDPVALTDNDPPAEPKAEAPVLDDLEPAEAELGDNDLELHVIGTGFVDGAVIVFNGGDEPATYVSATELTTVVRPSTATVEGSVPVKVRNPDAAESGELPFTFNADSGVPEPPAIGTMVELSDRLGQTVYPAMIVGINEDNTVNLRGFPSNTDAVPSFEGVYPADLAPRKDKRLYVVWQPAGTGPKTDDEPEPDDED